MKKISIIYSTNRIEPRFEWFIDSLINQTTDDDRNNIELIFIDYAYTDARWKSIREKVIYKCSSVEYSIPKLNIYSGKYRKTTGEYFSIASARNSGIILSTGEYLVFVDDLTVLMPTWWSVVKEAAEKNMIVCGAYQKHSEMVVENGKLISSKYESKDIDSRWNKGNDNHPVPIDGGNLFGCSLGIPAEDILQVNGFDEMCDSIGGEDYQLGIRLNHAGKQLYYDRRMLTIEAGDEHAQPYLMKREDRVLPPEHYMVQLDQYGVDKRHHQGNWDSSHMILDILYGLNLTEAWGNNYSLRECREKKMFPELPQQDYHWYDGKKLAEML